MVVSTRQRVVIVRPVENLLAVTSLDYDSEIKSPAMLGDEAPDLTVRAEEMRLPESRVGASTLVAPNKHERPALINLMDALHKRLANAQGDDKAPSTMAQTQQSCHEGPFDGTCVFDRSPQRVNIAPDTPPGDVARIGVGPQNAGCPGVRPAR
jgi:non-homologous end joining protein Ku